MTPFEKKVYRAVLTIPLGETRTYKWVAEKIGKPGSSRAVGQALNRNPYPFIIPCHRVVKSNKETGGYVFGVKRKKMILEWEKRAKQCLENNG